MRALTLFCAVGCLLSVGCTAWNFSASRTQNLTAGVPVERLVVKGTNGTISVRGEAVEKIQIQANLKAYGSTQEDADANLEEVVVQLEEREGDLIVFVEKPRLFRGSVSFEIVAPPELALRLESSNGAVRTEGMIGRLDLETSNGTIVAHGVRDQVLADTSNGTIEIEAAAPVSVRADTSNGKITFSGAMRGDDNRLDTSNGTIRLNLSGGALQMKAKTSNGKITLDGESLGKSAEVIVGETSGEVARVNVGTSNGRIIVQTIMGEASEAATEATTVESDAEVTAGAE